MYKKTFIAITALSLLLLSNLATPTHAMEDTSKNEFISSGNVDLDSGLIEVDEDGEISPQYIYPTKTRLYNKKKSTEWSAYKRISDNIKTGNSTGSITANRTVTFGTKLGGSATWFDAGINASVSSSKSYTMNVPKNSRVYLAYRVKYNVEKGMKCKVHLVGTPTCIDTPKSYTIKRPAYGEYALRNY